MIPTVGRIVYYKSYGTPGGEFLPEDRAAIVTFVHNPTCVDLCVFNPTGLFFNQKVVQGSEGGKWDWMPYQKQQQFATTPFDPTKTIIMNCGVDAPVTSIGDPLPKME